ncbi:MAG: hypothetical protein IJK02_09055 [Clostridia bacterium]|nr:hypothetical protein [Clostridia bacterium]
MQDRDLRETLRRLAANGEQAVPDEKVKEMQARLTDTQRKRLGEILSSPQSMEAFLQSPAARVLMIQFDSKE